MDGDGVLLEDVKGLNPDPEKHTSSVDVHVSLQGFVRLVLLEIPATPPMSEIK